VGCVGHDLLGSASEPVCEGKTLDFLPFSTSDCPGSYNVAETLGFYIHIYVLFLYLCYIHLDFNICERVLKANKKLHPHF
jgi:hypothetical protein